MPFKSSKQERWAHTEAGEKKLGKKPVDETISLPKDPHPEPFNPIRKSNWGGHK